MKITNLYYQEAKRSDTEEFKILLQRSEFSTGYPILSKFGSDDFMLLLEILIIGNNHRYVVKYNDSVIGFIFIDSKAKTLKSILRISKYGMKLIKSNHFRDFSTIGKSYVFELIRCSHYFINFFREAYISIIIVDYEFQGKGVGKEILRMISNLLLKEGIKELYVRSSPFLNHSFYEKLGFEKLIELESILLFKLKLNPAYNKK